MELIHKIITDETIVPKLIIGNLYYPVTELSHNVSRLMTDVYESGYHYTSVPILLKKGDRIRVKTNASSQGVAELFNDGYESGKNAYIYAGAYSTHKGAVIERKVDVDQLITILSNENTYETLEVEIYRVHEQVIDEPVGYDNLQVQLDRHDYHGIGAEASLGTLEFYGLAAELIQKSYENNIENKIWYSVTGDEGLKWLLDLSTYIIKFGAYKSVSCKVCEDGIKTIFNNRTEIEVDIETSQTIDGSKITKPEWKSVNLPTKHLLYTNISKRSADETYTTGGGDYVTDKYLFIGFGTYGVDKVCFPIGDDTNAEFGNPTEIPVPYCFRTQDQIDALYVPGEDHDEKYGKDTQTRVNIKLDFTMHITNSGSQFLYSDDDFLECKLELLSGDTIVGESEWNRITGADTKGKDLHFVCEINNEVYAGKNIKYYLRFNADTTKYPNRAIMFHATIHKGSYLKMLMYDNIEGIPTMTDVLMVNDAINVITDVIGEKKLKMRSDWYGYEDEVGGGALKALTNGYKIRDLFTTEDNERNMPISFKDMITNLSAIDCIGWGFSSEGGEECVRIERWDWFYQNDAILEIEDADEVTIEADVDRMISEFIVGYKKYATSDQYNSIESPHGSRSFSNGNKIVNKSLSKECNFIADNYAIEETRRDRYNKGELEESNYDENIFVLELVLEKRYVHDPGLDAGRLVEEIRIGNTATNATNVGRLEEFINAKLTPRHMAARWKDYLFQTSSKQPLKFTSGEINYKSSFSVLPYVNILENVYSLKTYEDSTPQVENEDIAYTQSKLKAEKITFSYPLTMNQYKKVKNNPYGLVIVNGIPGWIQNLKYSFADGMAEFTLIAKNTK